MNPDLTPDELAAIRKGIRSALASGMKPDKLDEYLTKNYGLTAAQAMKPTGRDADRAIMHGLTLGHEGQVAGAFAAMTGGNYAQTRDQTQTNYDEAKAANPWTMGVTSAIGGVGPAAAASLIPGMQPVAGATAMNALRGAGMGAGLGAIQGQGESRATTFGGQMGDAAIGAGIGGVFGGAGGAIASKLAGAGLPGGNAGAVAKEAATVIPLDPKQAVVSMARQEALAPGSVVLADASPEMQAIVRGIGADPKTAVAARTAATDRLKALVDARKVVGKNYDVLKGQMAPVDPELITAVASAGKRGILKGAAAQVDLGAVHDLRSQLLAEARATKNAYVSKQKNDAADLLTQWLAKKNPAIEQLDADYAFLTGRQKAAKETLVAITKSLAQHAAGRTYGVEPASVGASVPTTLRSVPGAAMQIVKKAVGTDRAARAKAVADLLLTPQRDATGFGQLAQLRDLVLNPPTSLGLRAGSAGLAGVVAPQSAGALVGALQP